MKSQIPGWDGDSGTSNAQLQYDADYHKGSNHNLTATISEALGGLGFFLLGMTVMTDGLRSLAGNAMRSALMRCTRTPLSGALTGAITTALLQSSSATTVATVGFVSAGLLQFYRIHLRSLGRGCKPLEH